jgi:hypothetical protein
MKDMSTQRYVMHVDIPGSCSRSRGDIGHGATCLRITFMCVCIQGKLARYISIKFILSLLAGLH